MTMLTARVGRDDFAEGAFERLAAAHESPGQAVEQFGMRWRPTRRAEVVGRIDQPPPETPLPELVDDHTRRERIAAAYDRFGQTAATIVKTPAIAQYSPRRKADHLCGRGSGRT